MKGCRTLAVFGFLLLLWMGTSFLQPGVTVHDRATAAQREAETEHTDKPMEQASMPKHAYLTIISNEHFVDGAIVLGASLRKHSAMLRSGDAHLVIMLPRNVLSSYSKERLCNKFVGSYDRIVEVVSLAARAPGAFFKDTFDKIYMFNLTDYTKVVYMDADMLCLRSPDALFAKNYGDSHFIGAIGGHNMGGIGTYFQTGMMVLRPNTEMFQTLMHEFEMGVPPRGTKYNRGMHGRDGVLFRNVFGGSFHPIDNKYSRNIDPRKEIPKSVVSLHFRGMHKPWHDKSKPVQNPELGKKDFGYSYVLWWNIYEEAHRNSPEFRAAKAASKSERQKYLLSKFGGTAVYSGNFVSPLTHVWMMRFTEKEYVQLLSAEDAKRRNFSLNAVTLVVGAFGQPCSTACIQEGLLSQHMHCSQKLLAASQLQECTVLKKYLICDKCTMGVYWKHHSGKEHPAVEINQKTGKLVCKFNYLHDERAMPTCDAWNETTRRLCPCVAA